MPIPFRPIARMLTKTLRPKPWVDLSAVEMFLPKFDLNHNSQGMLITVNHFSAPDFQAWWIAITISAVFPVNIHWVVTSGWEESGWLTGFTHWLFPLGSRILGFTPMPAVPPDPAEAEERALAVLKVLNYARHTSLPVIGLAPEGGDTPAGILGNLPSGAGRFIQVLSRYCPVMLPVGVWKSDGRIHVNFGNPYQINVPGGLSAQARDNLVGNTVMHHIAQCLPEHLQGDYR